MGGLATLGAALKALPSERFIYIGDLARVPYGDKSSASIRDHARSLVAFLVSQKVKAVAVACNTISAVASADCLGAGKTPLLHVLAAGAEAAIRVSTDNRIGVIATAATVREKGYERSIQRLRPHASVFSVDCPLLVPLIEEGWQERAVTREVVEEYLLPLQRAAVDTLVLGCTHYSFIQPAIRAVMGSHTRIVDPAQALAERLAHTIRDGVIEPAAPRRRPHPPTLFVTDHVERFQRVAARLCPGACDATIQQVKL